MQGCPVVMFKMEEVMETFSKLSVPDKELVCSSLFYCLNWYREVRLKRLIQILFIKHFTAFQGLWHTFEKSLHPCTAKSERRRIDIAIQCLFYLP
jgi:hypothetical protein